MFHESFWFWREYREKNYRACFNFLSYPLMIRVFRFQRLPFGSYVALLFISRLRKMSEKSFLNIFKILRICLELLKQIVFLWSFCWSGTRNSNTFVISACCRAIGLVEKYNQKICNTCVYQRCFRNCVSQVI